MPFAGFYTLVCGSIFVAPAQIFEYGAREKHVLLEHDSYLVSESVHVVFTHIVASDDYRAGVCVVETAYQVYKEDFELPVPPMMPMVSPDFMSRFISDRTGVSAVSEYLKVT